MNRCVYVLCALIAVAFASQGQTSRNGKFTAVIAKVAGAKNSRESNTWTAKILNDNGSARYQLLKEIPFDTQYPSLSLGDDGCSIVVSVFNGIIEFHDNTGNVVRTLELFGKKTAGHEQIIKCSVGGNRSVFVFSSPDGLPATVMMTTLAGEQLWRSVLSGIQAGEIFVSSDAKYVAACSYAVESNVRHFTQIFNENGKQLNTFDQSFRFADISANGSIALSDRNSMRLYSVSDAKPAFVWTSKLKEEIVTSVKIVNNHVAGIVEFVATESGVPTYKNPKLIVLNSKGTVVAQSALNTSSTNAASLSVNDTSITLSSTSSSASIALGELK